MGVPRTESELLDLIQNIDTGLAALMNRKIKSYTIGERTFTYTTMADLLGWRRVLQEELNSIPCAIVSVFDDPEM